MKRRRLEARLTCCEKEETGGQAYLLSKGEDWRLGLPVVKRRILEARLTCFEKEETGGQAYLL